LFTVFFKLCNSVGFNKSQQKAGRFPHRNTVFSWYVVLCERGD